MNQFKTVALTQSIINLLPGDKLATVIAHELGHTYHRDKLIPAIVATIAGAIL